MENSVSSLAYKGSIVEAIAEAKRQKKLFVVYVSGDDVESTRLEESTWVDSKVEESISKYCILLHIPDGSSDVAHFSAIYPQRSAPCITAIGYNGIQLWQNAGFLSADVLASSLEKAWLSLHIQETTATFLSVALASKKFEPHDTEGSKTSSFEPGSSSSMDTPPSENNLAPSSGDGVVGSSEMQNKSSDYAAEDIHTEHVNQASSGSARDQVEQPTSSNEIAKEHLSPLKVNQNEDAASHTAINAGDECPTPKENINVAYQHSGATMGTSELISIEASAEVKASAHASGAKNETLEDNKNNELDSILIKSTDVHFNIRLLNGTNLQVKFLVTDTLRMVKDYLDEKQESSIISYDLAIPYPRRVFNNQDLNKTLSELGLFGRQALIMVPHIRSTGYQKGDSSSNNQTNSSAGFDSSDETDVGYWAFMKKTLSYMNPFSYLGGGASSSNSAQESQSSMWQYSPNPSLQNNLRATGRSYSTYSSDQNTSTTSRTNTKSGKSTDYGSNIHTLRHDEDDSNFNDRNAYWNGNSTEYGGDNDGK